MATEDADGDEVEDEAEDEEDHEEVTEAAEVAEAATEDHETAKSPTKSNTPTTTTMPPPPPTVNRRTAMAPGQRLGEAASDHEVVSVVEAEAVEDEVDEAEDEVEAGTPTKASLVTTRPRLRSKPKIKYIRNNQLSVSKESTCLPLITLNH